MAFSRSAGSVISTGGIWRRRVRAPRRPRHRAVQVQDHRVGHAWARSVRAAQRAVRTSQAKAIFSDFGAHSVAHQRLGVIADQDVRRRSADHRRTPRFKGPGWFWRWLSPSSLLHLGRLAARAWFMASTVLAGRRLLRAGGLDDFPPPCQVEPRRCPPPVGETSACVLHRNIARRGRPRGAGAAAVGSGPCPPSPWAR